MNTDSAAIVFILGTVVLVLFALFLIFFLVVHKQRQYRYLIEKQQLEHQYQSQLLQSQIEVQEQAFQYFSGEIHDNVGQILSLTKLYLYKIAKNSTGTPVEEDANQGTELLTKAIADLRNISHTANGNYVSNTDLGESIRKELDYIASAKKIKCNFKKEGEPYPLEKEKNLLAFRIIQESVANALKHGNPTELDIALNYKPGTLSVSIIDNGEGFDTEVLQKGNGIGVNNMNVRANLLKGKLDIRSVKNEGTTVKLEIPV
jgi:two-component system, NarL family, sensor kinase